MQPAAERVVRTPACCTVRGQLSPACAATGKANNGEQLFEQILETATKQGSTSSLAGSSEQPVVAFLTVCLFANQNEGICTVCNARKVRSRRAVNDLLYYVEAFTDVAVNRPFKLYWPLHHERSQQIPHLLNTRTIFRDAEF